MRRVKALTSWEKPNLTQQEPKIWENNAEDALCCSHSGFKNYSTSACLQSDPPLQDSLRKMSPKRLARCGALCLQEGMELEGFSGRLKKRWREWVQSWGPSLVPMLDSVTEMGSSWDTAQEGWCNTNTATCSWSKNIQPCTSHLWLSTARDWNGLPGRWIPCWDLQLMARRAADGKTFHLKGLMFKCGWLTPRSLPLSQNPGILKGFQAITAKSLFPAVPSQRQGCCQGTGSGQLPRAGEQWQN